MTDLTRRRFIKNVSFAGAATLACGSITAQNTFTSFLDLETEKGENLLSKFSKSSFSNNFLFDKSLLSCYNKIIVNWQKIGYESASDYCYTSPDGRLKMFSMHLIKNSQKLDNVLLCFGKNENGEWRTIRSLSGFELEAISQAKTEFKKYNAHIDLSQYLFPSSIQPVNPFGYITPMGSVELKTILSEKETITKIVVKEGNNKIFEKNIISEHTLSVDSILA
ncbi:hypothetical protein [Flavobacterium sp.]|uniref:hypothetical protein n=1 Tax=Flavobacterium sp. TaxID=239 RepID=UPI0031E2E7A4